MRKLIHITLFAAALLFCLSCNKDNETKPVEEKFDVSGIMLPKTASVRAGEKLSVQFIPGRGPVEGDSGRFISGAASKDAVITDITADSFSIVIPETMVSGQYTFCIIRKGKVAEVSSISLTVVHGEDIVPDANSTVYGLVECEGKGVPDVLVSDGVLFSRTDRNGVYNMVSEKAEGDIFIITPSGYHAIKNGVQPAFWASLQEAPGKQERVDFHLVAEPGQEKHIMLFFGDIHLANRYKDRAQFSNFTKDVNEFVRTHPGTPVYAVTLGDMAWDQFWYTNSYDLKSYLADANSGMGGIMIYHTIGNHDHESGKEGDYPKGDFDTVVKYRKIIGPTYYSYNIGSIHYIALDNIKCTNPGDGTRTYTTTVTDDQLKWIRKDLSYVSKDTPVVVTMHAPLMTNNGLYKLTGADDLVKCFDGYKVRFVTGHSHTMFNIDYLDKLGYYEANSGSVCATWWWTGYYNSSIHISADGTPGGYRVMETDGNRITWRFKATGYDENFQFRTYDRNCISITADKFAPNATDANKAAFNSSAAEYAAAGTDNTVLINLWDYDINWKLEVTEEGKDLTVTRLDKKDPLHLISYEAYRYNGNASAISFPASNTRHLFSVKASSPNSTLIIKATDPYGRVYTETMKRPKEFSQNTYK